MSTVLASSARTVVSRDASVADLAWDLRAYLAGKPIAARAPGVVRRVRRWIVRQPIASTSLGLGTLALVAVTFFWIDAAKARDEAHSAWNEARESAAVAEEREREMLREKANLLRLADLKELRDLEQEQESLWPAHPDVLPELDDWLRRFDTLSARLPEHEESLERATAEAEAAHGDAASDELDWWRESLETLVSGLSRMTRGDGLRSRVLERRDAAATLAERSIGLEREWRAALRDIERREEYGGLQLEPQMGLVPIGPDPRSGLWEFWHVDSGESPMRNMETGELVMGELTGIVLVLVPGGTFEMGAQKTDPDATNYDPQSEEDSELPVHTVTLSPYFISKYEMTQGQWLRATGQNPSLRGPGEQEGGIVFDLSHPVEHVTWDACDLTLSRLGLEIPTEAQWEYATRAGTTTPWVVR